MAFGPPVKRDGDRFRIRLGSQEREALAQLCAELRDLLVAENPATDAAVARLFPPAYPDDPLRNLDYERGAGDGLLERRLTAIDTVTATIEEARLSEEQLLAWLGAVNDLRLVLGTRLDVTEETSERDLSGDDAAAGMYAAYRFLSWLEGWIVEALGAGDAS